MNRSRSRLLLVDSDPEIRELFRELLEDAGFEVVLARSPGAAVELLHTTDVQVVLADFIRSWHPLEAIRDAAAPAPVGLLSGWPVNAEDAQARGFRFVIMKPFEVEALFSTLAEQLRDLSVSDEQKAAVLGYFRALTERDWDGFVKLCNQHVRYHLPGEEPPYAATVIGRVALRSFTEATFSKFPGAVFEVTGIVPLPDGAVGRYTVTWPGLEKPQHGAVVFRFDGSMIREVGVRVRVRELAASVESRRAATG